MANPVENNKAIKMLMKAAEEGGMGLLVWSLFVPVNPTSPCCTVQ
jgi:hypothetical protein